MSLNLLPSPAVASLGDDAPGLLRALNVLVLRSLENGDKTAVVCCLVGMLLQPPVLTDAPPVRDAGMRVGGLGERRSDPAWQY